MTLYCGQCNTANRDGSVFCNRCGQRLGAAPQRPCQQCEAANLPDARFCVRCGAQLPTPNPSELPAALGPLLDTEEEEPLEAEVFSLSDLPAGAGASMAGRDDGERWRSAPDLTESEPEPPAMLLADADELLQRMEAGLGPGPATPVVGVAAGALPSAPLIEGEAAGRQRSPAEVFASVVATRSAWAPPPPAAPSRTPSRSARLIPRLLYLCLFAAVLVPFLVPGEWSGSTIPLTPSTAAFFQAVAGLRPGSPVLIAFDYDPSTQAELDPQARAVLAHLMQRGARISAVSLVPAGPAQAQLAFAATTTAQGYRYGEDYINLGYLAGGEAALATLNVDFGAAFPQDYLERQPAANRPALQGVRGVRDFALVVVVGSEEQTVVGWLTQVQARSGVKMVAGASAGSTAQLQPYLASGQLIGLLTGLPGAAEYELLMNQPGAAVRMLDAQSLAHVVIVVFVLLGNVGALSWGIRRKPVVASPLA